MSQAAIPTISWFPYGKNEVGTSIGFPESRNKINNFKEPIRLVSEYCRDNANNSN